jgi:hypothetical protein
MDEDLDAMDVDSVLPEVRRAQPVATSTNMARIKPFTERRIAALILHLLKTGDLLPASGKCEVIWSAGCPLLAISRHPEGSSRTSALPPKADIAAAKSASGFNDERAALQKVNDSLTRRVYDRARNVRRGFVLGFPD